MAFGIIGGTGLYEIGEAGWEPITVATPFGEVTAYAGAISGREAVFLPRHGREHSLLPHQVNYRANIMTLQMLHCDRVIAFNAVGSLSASLPVGSLCLAAQFLDFTCGRPRSLFEPPDYPPMHVDMTEPYCQELREHLAAAAQVLGMGPVQEVVYVCTEGPRFETAAEIRMFALLGGDVVGMTGVPEVVFAREARLCYASICVVTNLAAGVEPEHVLSAEEVTAIIDAKRRDLIALLEEAVTRIPQEHSCRCPRP